VQEEATGPGHSLSQGCYDSTSRDRSRVETEAGGLDARGMIQLLSFVVRTDNLDEEKRLNGHGEIF